jgi:hypothetical protein
VTPVEAKVIVFDGEAGGLDAELQLVLNEIEKQKAVMAPLEEKKMELEAKIKQMIGDAEEAHMPNGQVYTFKNVEVKEAVRKAYSFRKLVRKK